MRDRVNAAPGSPRRFSLLLVSHTYPPVLGGSEIEAQRVCASLRRRGHEVHVLCCAQPPMPHTAHWIDPYGTPVSAIGRRWPPSWRDRIFALAVASHLLFRRYDAVYFLMQGLHVAFGLPAARIRRKPIIMKFSGSGIIASMTRSFIGRVELKALAAWARPIMVLNEGMRAEAVNAGIDRQHLLWMPNPVDVDEFCPVSPEERLRLRGELDLSPFASVALFVGRLAPEKELPSLLTAFRRVVAAHPNALLALVGDGPEQSLLRSCAEQFGLTNHVRFVGRVPIEGVRRWLQASDVFTLVSSAEGFPCSLSEAMSAALPSVVSDIPANRQLISDGVHGILVGVRNQEALASGILKLFADPQLRSIMGGRARQVILANYSTDKVVDRYESVLANVIGRDV
jgi:glycosyltransferase involved in cell wall biosynthesis